ncbi:MULTISPECIES: aminomethyl-transferring glycine dehydrogenase [unclassified Pseudomonas]|uniref:aminomethyl-transferring glycine dehydrogenase n=1 Tax=unclassified Pseudomonas TaxID=196821 RepID=UPI001295C862|nr:MULTISPECIES: aminomethyl-transferring glycine dehydrogenase [unclassified Pseudomonas]MQT41825.1 aminomethyl-transferring glycine dehydrogenase [Pseudomonas sp. FSL R10-0765]MQT51626.1 aminomethyl-transferring glycine dehydrogenase [Pseudomonas sp. FSL R10-2398]MQU02147.1 aminomethyl-transferring glycine dehydrogenase [Pseudomonas sp. FSL R10-2245]MQU12859.1 aminomethyl-transferring glycine dehydrogenase [Pseudomonas sp. FSL R10-2189]MQU37405.1 aminomethyl-transferring glycine dehydrogenas
MTINLSTANEFIARHIGPRQADEQAMLTTLGFDSLQALSASVIPEGIKGTSVLNLPAGQSEADALASIKAIAAKNQLHKTYIGQGYYNCHTPSPILRNLLENPAWYTAYTPYQPEISQGRLEALLNFQTLISDLTGLPIANASLLDEATAAAEAMTFCKRLSKNKTSERFFASRHCHPQTLDVLRTRAEPLGIEVVVGDERELSDLSSFFGALLQYPASNGDVFDYRDLVERFHAANALVAVAADLLALTLLTPPGEFGADVAIGSAQRFGVPLGFGGPHAAYFSTRDAFKRDMPGRLVGMSVDRHGKPALRLAMQTREQHIRREKATSNICTAQVLLANIASMYAVYHGPQGLTQIARRIHQLTAILAQGLKGLGLNVEQSQFFDTLTLHTGSRTSALHAKAQAQHINLRVVDDERLGLSLDETSSQSDVVALWALLAVDGQTLPDFDALAQSVKGTLPAALLRQSAILSHPVFNRYHSETELMRYLRRLADKDLALDRTMIPLGSCTMKLNAASEMIPVTWAEFGNLHPFAPAEQSQGYQQLTRELELMLCEATGYDAVSLQPNAGSQGEYAGLLAIRAYHQSRGEERRDICLIPSSAHGTNPATAHMAGMRVVVTACDARGNVDIEDLRAKAIEHRDHLAALMITYPSTHGVFEEGIREICGIIHDNGGQVYIDGANMNAMVGLCAPGKFGGDVSHLNLHKTFCIPHGGGGPGVGPIGVKSHLIPFLPGHSALERKEGAVCAAPFGSASILPITWMYIRMMGGEGLKRASQLAILNANYIARRLEEHYPVLYSGANGLVAHECILDLRPLKETSGISVDDVAKRLIDFGFHAPTMSFPVAGTLMIEPTESESKQELDRFCEAMIRIREEIRAVENGTLDKDDNPLKNAPHTAAEIVGEWTHPYSREQAVYPVASLIEGKYWPPVGRVDNVFGDRNLVCACPSIESYQEA